MPIAAFRGTLPWPVAGTVRTPLRPPQAPAFDTYTRAERDRDRRPPPDTPVARRARGHAWSSPTASAATGSWWCVDHGGKHHTLYAHLGEARVQAGQQVAAGEVVGTVGSSGLGGPGLYFEMRFQGRPRTRRSG